MKSIQSKIIIYVSGSLLLLFLLLLYSIQVEMNETVVPLNKNLTSQLVNARGEQISQWFDERIEEIKLMGYNIDYFNLNKEEALKYLESIRIEKENIYESLGVIDEEGMLWVTDGSRFSIVNRKYYKTIITENTTFVISEPIKSQSNQENIVVVIYRLSEENTENIQYISAAVPIDKLKEIAADIYLYDGEGKIVDNKGNYIKQEEYFYQENAKEALITFKTPIKNSPGWQLTFKIAESRLTDGMRKLQHQAVTIGGLVGGALIILMIFFSTSIVKPVKKLQRLMREVETGDLSVRFNQKGNDEINMLGKSFNQMLEELDRVQCEKKEMELKLMQEQVKPHFLYNTLDTIRWSAIEYEANEVVELIEALSTYFRIGFSKGKNFVSVEEELDHVESYLCIQKARYEDLLKYDISYDESIIKESILKVILQPIIENAIQHGFRHQNSRECKIAINLYREEEVLYITIKDNGIGIENNKLIRIQEAIKNDEIPGKVIGFGLYSANHRIKLLFGESYGLNIEVEDGWTIVTIKYPLARGGYEDVEGLNC